MDLPFTRRAFLGTSSVFVADAASLSQFDIFSRISTDEAKDYAADRQTVEGWMNQWITASKRPIGALHVSRFADPIYYLLTPVTWTPNPGQEGFQPVTVPVGFVTDFASIPRAFWSILRPDGLYTYPAIVHDYLYWTQARPREAADKILEFGMEDFSVDAISRATIYDAVHAFGWVAWNENAKLKAKGERRTEAV